MKKFKVERTLSLNPPHVIGLTAAQHATRSHNLVRAEGHEQDLPLDVRAYEVTRPVQFRVGEEIYSTDLPKALTSPVKEEAAESGEESKADEGGKAAGDAPTKSAAPKPKKGGKAAG